MRIACMRPFALIARAMLGEYRGRSGLALALMIAHLDGLDLARELRTTPAFAVRLPRAVWQQSHYELLENGESSQASLASES
jgi:hypothetical protein